MSIKHPLRFCMVTTFYPPYSFGGDANYVQNLSHELAQRGHHVEVIHCLDSYHAVAHGEALRETKNHPNITIHPLKSSVGALSPMLTHQTGYPFFKTKQIKKILARGFDVVHYHNISLVGGPRLLEMEAPSPRAGQRAVKLYATHEYWLMCPTNVLFRYDGVACEDKQCLRCTLANRRPPQWWRYTKLLQNAARQIDMFLYPSEFTRERHQREGLNGRGTLFHYFSAMPTAAPAPPPENELPYFLYVGRLEPLKGAHTLIPLFRNYPRARLLMIGDGTQMAELKALAADAPNIEFHGWLNQAELYRLYQNATALLMPSLCYEAGPLVVLEAYSHGVPTLARQLGAIPEIVHQANGGLTYTDNESLRALINELLDNPARHAELSDNARAAYQREFTPEAHLDRYLEIVEMLLAEQAQKST